MAVTYEVAVGIAIGAIIAATLFRTFLPLFIKIRAENTLAQRENRPAVMPKIEPIWLYMAGINVIMFGFIVFASVDTFVQPILDATTPFVGFFVVFGLANTSLEALFRMADSGVPETPKPTPTPPS